MIDIPTQLRKLTTGGPGVMHIASETLFEDAAAQLEEKDAEIERLREVLNIIQALGKTEKPEFFCGNEDDARDYGYESAYYHCARIAREALGME